MKLHNLLLAALLLSCTPQGKQEDESASDQTESKLDFEALSALLMDRMDLQPEEGVLLVATPGRFDPLIEMLGKKIEASEASYLGTISVTDNKPESWNTLFVDGINGLNEEELLEYLKQVDIGIMLPGPTPDDLVYGLMQDNLDAGIGRTIHFHWEGAYDLSGAPIEINDEIDAFYQNVLVSTKYEDLATSQRTFEAALRNQLVRVTTPAGTDISFEIGDRPVTKQNGNASALQAAQGRNLIDREIELPSGAIRVAPIETSVNGKIAFPDAKWGENEVNGLVLTFEKGKVVDMEAAGGLNYVEQVMEEAGESARSFREFALGMNPMLAIPTENPWIPYYGYGAGVVRLSLGDNTELGGDVSGGFVRWNFFIDATVNVGDDMWVKDGELIR